jgi:hypothetical protein
MFFIYEESFQEVPVSALFSEFSLEHMLSL